MVSSVRSWFLVLILCFAIYGAHAQSGNIIETGDVVLDPNGDGFISTTNAGFLGDGYDPDEFEIKLFGIPIFGDGEALADTQSGAPCGVSDLTLDTGGYAMYAGLDNSENFIFRVRVAANRPSVQSYSIFIDTDGLIGADDPNSLTDNPGFELEVTLIQGFGVYLYDIDGIDSCPTPSKEYSVDTHQQKSTSSLISCETVDYFIDFYVPFSDITEISGVTVDTDLKLAGVTNISATCALDGSISDIGGVDDTAYDGCFSCAMIDLAENQCPSSASNLCEICAGFPEGATQTPTINLPILVGDTQVDGIAELNADVFLKLFDDQGVFLEEQQVVASPTGDWVSNVFLNPLNFGDSILVNALVAGKCESGLNDTGLSFAIVSPNQPPIISGTLSPISYIENSAPLLIADDFTITDDNAEMESMTVQIVNNYELDQDILSATTFGGITVLFDPLSATLSFNGTAPIADYISTLQSVSFHNLSDNPSLNIRTIEYQVYDGINQSPITSRNILITEVNDSPIVVNAQQDTLFITAIEDIPLPYCIEVIDIESNDVSINNFLIDPVGGSVNLDGGTCFTFFPEENYDNDVYVEMELCDNGIPPGCTDIVVAIDIQPVNDPPQLLVGGNPADTAYFIIEKNASLDFCLNGYDPEGDEILLETVAFNTSNGSSINWNNGLCLTYDPSSNFVGRDVLEIVLCDNVTPKACAVFYVAIDVVDFNSPPVIIADTLRFDVLENNSHEFCIEVTDADNNELNITSIIHNVGGSGLLNVDGLCMIYVPEIDFSGTDYFTVQVCDNITPPLCDEVVLEFNVIPFNNPPFPVDDLDDPIDTVYLQTKVGVPLEYCVVAIDPDGDNVLLNNINLISGDGSVAASADLCVLITPGSTPGEIVSEIELCDDGDPTACSNLIAVIEVSPENTPPVITKNLVSVDTLFYTATVNELLNICIEAHDEEEDLLQITSINAALVGGSYEPVAENLCLNFIPANNYEGRDIRTVEICDNYNPRACDNVVIVIDVIPINHEPSILSVGIPTDTLLYTIEENNSIEICLDAIDPDDDALIITNSNIVEGLGSMNVISGLCLNYDPQFNFTGDTWINTTVCDDGFPQLCASVSIGITVQNVNQPPRILKNKIDVDTIVYTVIPNTQFDTCLDVTDADGDDLLLDGNNLDAVFGQLLAQDSLCFSYTPANDFLGNDYAHMIVCDSGIPSLCDTVVVHFEVLSINTAPQILYNAVPIDTLILATYEESLVSAQFTIADLEGGALQLTDNFNGANGLLETSLTTMLDMDYTPALNTVGEHQFTLFVCDSGLPNLCDSVLIIVGVDMKNNPPVAVQDDFSVQYDEDLFGNLLANDSDPDLDSIYLDISSTSLPSSGTIDINSAGEFIYTPVNGFVGQVTFNYTLCDFKPNQICVQGTVVIDVFEPDKKIVPSQGVSPNGDGYNDYWNIEGIKYYPNNKIQIFDRWNNKVFEIGGYNNEDISWVGQATRGLGSSQLNNGTYFYLITPGDGQSVISGMVILKK